MFRCTVNTHPFFFIGQAKKLSSADLHIRPLLENLKQTYGANIDTRIPNLFLILPENPKKVAHPWFKYFFHI
jgi:hypothetical protein